MPWRFCALPDVPCIIVNSVWTPLFDHPIVPGVHSGSKSEYEAMCHEKQKDEAKQQQKNETFSDAGDEP